MPLVSVIVPNYNHAPFLEKRIDSILDQTFQYFEIILLDDCSTDNSGEILEKYASHSKVSHFIINKKNSGSPFKQWKKGIDIAKGEFIWIAESDDWAEPEFLVESIKILKNYPKVGLISVLSIIVDEKGFKIGNTREKLNKIMSNDDYYFADGEYFINNYMLDRNYLPNASSILFRKSLVGQDLTYIKMKQAGDRMFWINILRNSHICYIFRELNYFRRHQNSVTEINTKSKYSIPIIENYKVIQLVKIKSISKSNRFWKDKYIGVFRRWKNARKISNLPPINKFKEDALIFVFLVFKFPLILIHIVSYGINYLLKKQLSQVL